MSAAFDVALTIAKLEGRAKKLRNDAELVSRRIFPADIASRPGRTGDFWDGYAAALGREAAFVEGLVAAMIAGLADRKGGL